MALTERFASTVPRRRGQTCGMSPLRSALPNDAEREALDKAIELVRSATGQPTVSTNYTCSWLHAVLIDEGFNIGLHTVRRHIFRRCMCGF